MHWRLLLAALAGAALFMTVDLSVRDGALAQRCPLTPVHFILRDGRDVIVTYCVPFGFVMSLGQDRVGAGEVIGVKHEGPKVDVPVQRALVRFICLKRCPSELPAAEAAQDTLAWPDGSRTSGRLSVQCLKSVCRISQDGKPVGKDFSETYGFIGGAAYLEFGRP